MLSVFLISSLFKAVKSTQTFIKYIFLSTVCANINKKRISWEGI